MKVTPKQPPGHALGWCVHRGPPNSDAAGFRVTFFVRAVVSITPFEPPVISDLENIVPTGDTPHDDPAHGLRYPSDFVPRKPFGEVIVVGTAHPPVGQEVNRFPVRVAVGDWRKDVIVHGDRQRDSGGLVDVSGPAAIVGAMPLTFARAFGGAGVAANPLGCGADGVRVPNLELAAQPITGRRSDVDPAGFGSIPSDWPQRRQHAGMPGKTGVAAWWPWSPPQFDERFWMATLPDQWVEGYFHGDEPVELVHLHPEHAQWRTALPGQRARVFLLRLPDDMPLSSARRGRLVDAEARFEEVPLVLDTVFIDADAAQMTLVWRGSTPVRSPKLLDILGVSFGLEPLDENRDPRHYLALLLAEENEAAEAAVPDGAAIKAEIEAAIAAGEAERARIVAEMEAEVAKAAEWAQTTLRDAEGRAGTDLASMSADLAARGIAVPEELSRFRPADALRIDLPATVPVASPGSSAVNVSEILTLASDLRLRAASAEAELPAEMREAMVKQAAQLEEISEFVGDAEKIPALLEAKTQETKAEIESAFPPGFLVNRVVKPGESLDLEAIRRDGLAEYDVRGVDFSGLDLGGVSFRGAAAAGAVFRRAGLAGADFTAANLTGADLTGADLTGAVLEQTDLTEAVVEAARFTNCRIGGTILRGLALANADFSGATGQYADFSGAELSNAVFHQARLDQPDFAGARAAGADFSRAFLAKADFGGAVCTDAIFDDASLPNVRARESADFTGARLHRVKADDASWTTSILDRADFQDADLRRNDFSECSLDQTNLDRCDLASAVFADSGIHAAAMTDANLIRASFDRASIVDVRFDGSSLFEAGFWDASLVRTTFAGCNVRRATISLAKGS
ncbi:MAG: DUF2169 domain-containing protein [Planctomycetota bacterium]|nr:MAG: DUF2169 domain-containing protein [Planctomycetota bacterium]